MEIITELKQPYTDKQRMDFIVENNHNKGYEIRQNGNSLEAWGYTEEELQEQQKQAKDLLTLTPADVERALYKAKGMDFEDLKALIAEKLPTIDTKALAIEFRAKDFYRGAEVNGVRLFDVVGSLLGYTTEDIDNLFLTKELPAAADKEESNEDTTTDTTADTVSDEVEAADDTATAEQTDTDGNTVQETETADTGSGDTEE